MIKPEEHILTSVMEEIRFASDYLKSLETSNERLMGLGLTILGGSLAIGIRQDIATIVIGLPFGLYGLYLYSIFLDTYIMSLNGYRRYLEEKANAILGSKVYKWETYVENHLNNRGHYTLFGFIYSLVLAFSVYQGAKMCNAKMSVVFLFSYLILNSIILCIIYIYWRRMRKMRTYAYEQFKAGEGV